MQIWKALGSDSNSNGLQIDARTYLNFPAKSKNVLAFWTFDWVVTNGTPPYLLLPSTGWDDFTIPAVVIFRDVSGAGKCFTLKANTGSGFPKTG